MTVTVVDAPAASAAVVPPELAKTAEAISGTPESVSCAVAVCAPTLRTVKTVANACACGTPPKASARLLTSPVAIGVVVPGCTTVPDVTEK